MSRRPSIHRVHKVLKGLKGRLNPHLETLRARVRKSPIQPGIYKWKDAKGDVLYVGKAKNLRKRLAWYVTPRPGAFVGPWRDSFLQQIADFDVTVTNTELEALILETNLIKEMKPKYNVLMKDDKNYLYIKVTVQDPYPRIEAARKIEQDGSKYFGPTTSGYEVRQTLALLRRLYPFRTCKMEIEPSAELFEEKNEVEKDSRETKETSESRERDSSLESPVSLDSPDSRRTDRIHLQVTCTHKDRPTPCLDYHIEQCSAPCIGTKTPEEYFKESIEGVLHFLKGDREPARALLKEQMMKAAMEKKFELAAEYRNHLADLEKMQERQIISDPSGENSDIIGVAVLSMRAHVVVLQRRNGKLVGENHFALAGQAEDPSEVLEQFLPQYYDDLDIPDAVLLSTNIPSRVTLAKWFSEKRGKKKVNVIVPVRGKKSQLVAMAEKNAIEKAKSEEIKWESEKRNTDSALETLQTLLHLPALPKRIEGYDISHLGGTETVGSMVVMKDGKSQNDQYRSFTIRGMQRGTIDDYAALHEVLRRRLRYLVQDFEAEETAWKQNGIEVGRARKADTDFLRETCHMTFDETKNPQQQGSGPADGAPGADGTSPPESESLDYRICTAAREGESIVAAVCLCTHPKNIRELCCLWVAEHRQGQRLEQFLIRKVLRSVKKGKVYAIIDASQELAYGELGFRYVMKPPQVLQDLAQKRSSTELPSPMGEGPGVREGNGPVVVMYESHTGKEDSSLTSRPDLIVIDGGKGQLSTVMDVVRGYQLDIPVIGLAKREEEVFLPDQGQPVLFDEESPAKFLLMRLRDEAHRFANRHREKRGKSRAIRSKLDEIPGIGEETRVALLRKFGTVSTIRTTPDSVLLEIVTQSQLEALRQYL